MRHRRRIAKGWAIGLLALSVGVTAEANAHQGCLFSFTVGPEQQPVGACVDGDPLGIGKDSSVLATMKVLGIPANAVRFLGCSGQPFSAAPDFAQGAKPTMYIVRYPLEAGRRYLAPIVHELGHVMQMRIAGGLAPLRESGMDSRQIELGADFLAGFVFSGALRHVDIDEFQHNLSLIGLYFERSDQAHGTPDQRIGAFRIGVVRAPPYHEFDAPTASRYFKANTYPILVRP